MRSPRTATAPGPSRPVSAQKMRPAEISRSYESVVPDMDRSSFVAPPPRFPKPCTTRIQSRPHAGAFCEMFIKIYDCLTEKPTVFNSAGENVSVKAKTASGRGDGAFPRVSVQHHRPATPQRSAGHKRTFPPQGRFAEKQPPRRLSGALLFRPFSWARVKKASPKAWEGWGGTGAFDLARGKIS